MKTIVLFLVLVFSSIICFGNTSISEEALTIINVVCDKLEIPAKEGFSYMVSGQIVKGISGLVMFGIVIISGFLLYILGKKFKIYSRSTNDNIDIIYSMFIIVIAMLLLVTTFNLWEVIIQLSNPEYAAIKEILELI